MRDRGLADSRVGHEIARAHFAADDSWRSMRKPDRIGGSLEQLDVWI